MFLITFAIVKVLPDPVTPNKVCAGDSFQHPFGQLGDSFRLVAGGLVFGNQFKIHNSMFGLMRCKNTVISLDIIYSSLKNRLLSTF